MLDISRIQAGKLSLNQEPTDLVEFVRSVLDRFSEELTGSGIEVAIDVKYAPGAPVSIQLSSAGRFFRLVFQDGGPGIPEDNRERILQRFERLVSASHVSGLELGLYIVRQIVETHGGRIYVAGNPVPSARFVIELPRAETADRNRSPKPILVVDPRPGRPGRTAPRVSRPRLGRVGVPVVMP